MEYKSEGAKRHAYSFRDLMVYEKSFQLAHHIFVVSTRFPREELYSLTDQMRRSSRSIGAQIAEAWAKRTYEKSFVAKLTDADAEQMETQHWIAVATKCAYLDKAQELQLRNTCEEIGRMLAKMKATSHQFCGPSAATLKETQADYFVSGQLNPRYSPDDPDAAQQLITDN